MPSEDRADHDSGRRHRDRLEDYGAGGARAARAPGHGLRAVSIAIDRVKGVSGLIEPGDRVDVIAVPQRVGEEIPKASTILRGVLVLAMGNETETASATPSPDNQNLTTVTLAVNPQQANLLALADVYATLRLALRSPDESSRAYPTEPIQFGKDDQRQTQAAAPAAPAVQIGGPGAACGAGPGRSRRTGRRARHRGRPRRRRLERYQMSRRVFVVVGTKGGCGATTITFELAKRMTEGGSPVLVDGDLGGRRSHAVTFDVIDKLDANRVSGSPALAWAQQCSVLELTSSYEDGFVVKSELIENIVAPLPADTTFIVDAPQPFAAPLRWFVTRASRFVVVVEPTLLGVSATQQMLSAMTRFGVPSNRIVLVLNSRDGIYEMNARDVSATLGVKVVGDIPQKRDRNYVKALNSLASELQKVQHLEPLPDLRPSASSPIGGMPDVRSAPEPEPSESEPGSHAGAGAHAETSANGHAKAPTTAQRIFGFGGGRTGAPALREDIKADIHAAMMARIDFASAARMYTTRRRWPSCARRSWTSRTNSWQRGATSGRSKRPRKSSSRSSKRRWASGRSRTSCTTRP